MGSESHGSTPLLWERVTRLHLLWESHFVISVGKGHGIIPALGDTRYVIAAVGESGLHMLLERVTGS